jgi:cellulose synthase/poly-beta-1,6-N-acetylglucosamine synthase-like glycosyltransferase
MFDFQPLFEFSRQNCVAICSFLVPAILLTTIATLILVATSQSLTKMCWSRGVASVLASVLFLHVSTWFTIGIVTPITFILLGLGSTCSIINIMAVAYRQEVQMLGAKLTAKLLSLT